MSSQVSSIYSSAVSAADSTQNSTTTSKTNTTEMLGEEFMQLMLAQMRNQNPLEPMKENEMFAQITQLNSLQQLEKISKSLAAMEQTNQFMSASNLIGKTVIYQDDKDKEVSALVKEVYLEENTVMLKINDTESIPLSSVIGIQKGS